LLDTVWDEQKLLTMLDTIEATVRPYLEGNSRSMNQEEVEFLRGLIRTHAQDIQGELDAKGWPNWDRPVKPPHCVSVENTYRGVLTTRAESLDADIAETGDGEATVTHRSETADVGVVRGIVGSYVDDFNDENIVVEIAVGPVADGGFVLVGSSFPKELYYEGNTISIDYGQAQAEALSIDIGTGEMKPLGFIVKGSLVIEAVGQSPGDDVRIAFEAPVGTFRF
jgi:hypothetical protein